MTSMDRASELALIRRLRNRDAAAFDEVHAQWNGRLFSFLVRLCRRRDLAEDLLEETWLRVVRHAHRLHADTHLGAWLYTIARNLHVSYCRTRLLDEGSASMGLWPAAAAPPSPFEATAASEMERRLERALASLPAWAREVLLLVGVEGLTPSEAAAVCGVRPEALRQRLSRARALLAARLDEADRAASAAILKEVLP
jgi:RNA polymerase sigma-70 factor (ECF subfamily)